MRVILDPEDYGQWLDPRAAAVELLTLMRPFSADAMTAFPVITFVSNPRNQGPQCIQAFP
jgi:putative SOS response-associated peptidase YedK